MTPPAAILIRMPNWLGDAVMAMPALRYLRRAFPGAGLFLAGRRHFAALLRAQAGVAGFVEAPASGIANLAASLWRGARELPDSARRADMGILLTNSLSSAIWLRRLGVKRRIGYSVDGRRTFLTDPVPRGAGELSLHFVRYYLRLAQAAEELFREEGGPAPPRIDAAEFRQPRLDVSPADRERARDLARRLGLAGGYAVFAPASAYGPVKDWPVGHYRALAESLEREYSLPVAVAGPAGQAGVCSAIAEGRSGVVNLAGQTGLDVFAGLIAGAALFVGGDSGGAHVAAALGIPTLVIFGVTNPSRTRPLGARVTLIGPGGEGDVKLDSAAARAAARLALEGIGPEEVMEKAREALRTGGEPRAE